MMTSEMMLNDTTLGVVHDKTTLDALFELVFESSEVFKTFSQEQVDKIFTEAALAANEHRVSLAEMATQEAGMGVLEDKTLKNQLAAEFVHATYINVKTCGVIENDVAGGFSISAEPMGILAGVVPCTNPTSTTIFKCLLSLKTRNCMIFSPHPRTRICTIATAKRIRDAAVRAGAPPHCIAWIDSPSVALCHELMSHPRTSMIVATGATNLVKAAYSTGKPAFGGGAGNTPVVIDETADIKTAVNSVMQSKTFDNGMICASEQAVVVMDSVAQAVKEAFASQGGTFVTNDNEKKKLGDLLINEGGRMNPDVVGKTAPEIAQAAGLEGNFKDSQVLLAELLEVGDHEKLSREKLCPCLGFYTRKTFDDAVKLAQQLVEFGGMGHTSVLYTKMDGPLTAERVAQFQRAMQAGRTLICMPTSHGAIGNIFNFRQTPSFSLGCGSCGGNITAEGLQVKHLLNLKQTSYRRPHALWFKTPNTTLFGRGTIRDNLHQLQDLNLTRAMIVYNGSDMTSGLKTVQQALDDCGILSESIIYSGTQRPNHKILTSGVEKMNIFNPDVIIAIGDNPIMDIAKLLRLLSENPTVEIESLGAQFIDPLKKFVKILPGHGLKGKVLVCVPTTIGVEEIVGPSATMICKKKPEKTLTLIDWSLAPDMVLFDSLLVTDKGIELAYAGFNALSAALEAHVSLMASHYTKALSMKAIKILLGGALFNAVKGIHDVDDCQIAGSLAGMAIANASSGIGKSITQELTSRFNSLPPGLVSAIVIEHVIQFNCGRVGAKKGIFSSQGQRLDTDQEYALISKTLYDLSEENSVEQQINRLLEELTELRTLVGIPDTLQDAGVKEHEYMAIVDSIALSAFDAQTTRANPRVAFIKDIKDLLLKVYWGKNHPRIQLA